jgi:hypothetical protein
MNAEITNDQAEELAGMANKPRPIAYAKPFIVLRRGLIMQHIAICNHEGHGYTIPIYTEAPQTALSQPAAVEGWHNVVDNVANNLGEFAGAMPTQDMADTLTEYANDLFGLLSAAPATPSAPVQQSVEHHPACPAVDIYSPDTECTCLSTSPLLDKNDQAEGEKLEWEDYEKIRDFREVDFAINNFHLNCTADNAAEMVKAIVENTRNYPQPPQPDSNELVELRRDAERWRYCVSRGDFPKRPIKAATGQQSAGWLYKVSEFRVWFDSAGEAADAALAQSPSKKGGE